jgi:hypothetical protein
METNVIMTQALELAKTLKLTLQIEENQNTD